jgi:SAM-dependent methyltransferase
MMRAMAWTLTCLLMAALLATAGVIVPAQAQSPGPAQAPASSPLKPPPLAVPPPQPAAASAVQGGASSQAVGNATKPPVDRNAAARRSVRIFPPEKLAELEGPDRELWQKPDQIMDALAIADGSVVADLGAGGGWFTVRLARRVGPHGIVFAQDIQEQMLESIERRMQREGLRNVRTVLGQPDDPRLPRQVQATLIVDVYHEVENQVELLRNIRESLAPNGRLGIVEFRKDGVGPGPPMDERVDESVVIANAETAGLRLIRRETFLPYQYLLVFGRE